MIEVTEPWWDRFWEQVHDERRVPHHWWIIVGAHHPDCDIGLYQRGGKEWALWMEL